MGNENYMKTSYEFHGIKFTSELPVCCMKNSTLYVDFTHFNNLKRSDVVNKWSYP